jgi:hypothetical protein
MSATPQPPCGDDDIKRLRSRPKAFGRCAGLPYVSIEREPRPNSDNPARAAR